MVMRRTGETSQAGRREPLPAAPRGGRTVLGVLVENGQHRLGVQVSPGEPLRAAGPARGMPGRLCSPGRKGRLGEALPRPQSLVSSRGWLVWQGGRDKAQLPAGRSQAKCGIPRATQSRKVLSGDFNVLRSGPRLYTSLLSHS